MKKVFFIFLVIIGLTSCKMYRTYTFNADQSGTMESKIDLTQVMAMMNQQGSSESMGFGNMMGDQEITKVIEQLQSIQGVSNVKVEFDTTGIYTTTYQFANITTLNQAMNIAGNSSSMMMGATGSDGDAPKASIAWKGKKFTLTELDKNTLKKMDSKEMKDQMGQMDMLTASSEIITTINFPSTVKKTSYKNAVILNGNSVFYTTPVKDYLSTEYKPLVVNLK